MPAGLPRFRFRFRSSFQGALDFTFLNLLCQGYFGPLTTKSPDDPLTMPRVSVAGAFPFAPCLPVLLARERRFTSYPCQLYGFVPALGYRGGRIYFSGHQFPAGVHFRLCPALIIRFHRDHVIVGVADRRLMLRAAGVRIHS